MTSVDMRRRKESEKIRKTWTRCLSIFFLVFVVLSIGAIILNISCNQIVCVAYHEESDITSRIGLFNNSWFKQVSEDKVYVSSYIDTIDSTFKYKINVDSNDIDYSYRYKIEKYIDCKSAANENLSYDMIDYEELVNRQGEYNSSKDLEITENVSVSYSYANRRAKEALASFRDSSANAHLVVKMTINVIGQCEDFVEEGTHVILYETALAVDSTRIVERSSIPSVKDKTITCKKDCKIAMATQYIYPITLALSGASLLALFIFLYLTKDKYSRYDGNIKNIMRNYKSFIQKTKSEFSFDGYKLVKFESIRELLEVRETLSLPVIMKENDDKTCANFFIAGNGILYIFAECMEGYESLKYKDDKGMKEEENKEKEENILDVTIEEKTIEEPQQERETDEEKLDEEVEESLQEDKFWDKIDTYNYSFSAKLSLAEDNTKEFYKDISKFVLSYGLKIKNSFKKERIYLGKDLFAQMIFSGKKLGVLFALDPKDYADSKYKFKDLSSVNKYKETPMLVKATSKLRVKQIKELLLTMFKKEDIKDKGLNVKVEEIETKTFKELVSEGLIKIKNKKQK